MAALLWSSQRPVGAPSRYFSRIKASWMARQRLSSISFCPRRFHEPRRLDFVRCTLPLFGDFEICLAGLGFVRVFTSAQPHDAAKRQNNATTTSSRGFRFLVVSTTKQHLRAWNPGPKNQYGVEHHFTFGCPTPLRCSPR